MGTPGLSGSLFPVSWYPPGKAVSPGGGRPSLGQCVQGVAGLPLCAQGWDQGKESALLKGKLRPGAWQPLAQLLTTTEGPSGHKLRHVTWRAQASP